MSIAVLYHEADDGEENPVYPVDGLVKDFLATGEENFSLALASGEINDRIRRAYNPGAGSFIERVPRYHRRYSAFEWFAPPVFIGFSAHGDNLAESEAAETVRFGFRQFPRYVAAFPDDVIEERQRRDYGSPDCRSHIDPTSHFKTRVSVLMECRSYYCSFKRQGQVV